MSGSSEETMPRQRQVLLRGLAELDRIRKARVSRHWPVELRLNDLLAMRAIAMESLAEPNVANIEEAGRALMRLVNHVTLEKPDFLVPPVAFKKRLTQPEAK